MTLLAVAVVAVSASAPLIRYAAAPALAIAFWRNALALPVVGLVAARHPSEWRALGAAEWRLCALAAAYVTIGAEVRRTVSTVTYASVCYAGAAAILLVVCVAARLPLGGYSPATWWALAGLVVGPQLLGHTLVNRVLRSLSPTIVSVAILFEVVGATLLAWLWFGEVPPVAAVPAALLVLAGVVLVVRSTAAVVAPAVD